MVRPMMGEDGLGCVMPQYRYTGAYDTKEEVEKTMKLLVGCCWKIKKRKAEGDGKHD